MSDELRNQRTDPFQHSLLKFILIWPLHQMKNFSIILYFYYNFLMKHMYMSPSLFSLIRYASVALWKKLKDLLYIISNISIHILTNMYSLCRIIHPRWEMSP